jgi:quercetin dioxygenase-like cupin family protein
MVVLEKEDYFLHLILIAITMDTEVIKSGIVTNVYQIQAGKKIALHKHQNHDELFYCISGEGFGVLENEDIILTRGKVFNVPAGTLHALKTESELLVSSFLIPVFL